MDLAQVFKKASQAQVGNFTELAQSLSSLEGLLKSLPEQGEELQAFINETRALLAQIDQERERLTAQIETALSEGLTSLRANVFSEVDSKTKEFSAAEIARRQQAVDRIANEVEAVIADKVEVLQSKIAELVEQLPGRDDFTVVKGELQATAGQLAVQLEALRVKAEEAAKKLEESLEDFKKNVDRRFRGIQVVSGPSVASAITFTPTGSLASTNVQEAIAEAASEAGGGGAPTTADYLVGTAQAGLDAEIVVGATPGGELGGTWDTPTVDTTHSGSSHAAVQAAAEATAASALTAHDDNSAHGIADTADLIRRAAALTAGRIPFVSAGDTLDDDAALLWNDTTKLLTTQRLAVSPAAAEIGTTTQLAAAATGSARKTLNSSTATVEELTAGGVLSLPLGRVERIQNAAGMQGMYLESTQSGNSWMHPLMVYGRTSVGSATPALKFFIEYNQPGKTGTVAGIPLADMSFVGSMGLSFAFYQSSTNPIYFFTNDQEKMRVDGANLGAGETALFLRHDVSGTEIVRRVTVEAVTGYLKVALV